MDQPSRKDQLNRKESVLRSVLAPLAAAWILCFSLEPAPGESQGPPAPASRAETEAFLTEWAARSQAVKALAIRFEQEKKLRLLRRPRVSEGDLVYSEKKLSIVVRGADGEVESEILCKDGELKILYPRLKRLEVIKVGDLAGPPGASNAQGPPMPFFTKNPFELEKDYKLTLERLPEGKDILTLVPKDETSPLKRLEMVFVRFEVREYQQVESSGDELRVRVLSAKVNPDVPAARFELKVPDGTQVTYPAGK